MLDENHSNSHTAWLALGSPQSPSKDQILEIQKAGALTSIAAPTFKNNQLQFPLTRQAVTLIELDWK